MNWLYLWSRTPYRLNRQAGHELCHLYQMSISSCIVVCPWAEKGAAAWCNGEVLTVAANPPGQVVDTLGAGDTFVAGFLHARARHMPVSYALDFACSLAAAKCTMDGFEGLQHFAKINICA